MLNIALTARNIGIVRYLVVDKRMLLWAEKDLSIETLVQNLDLVLRILPEEALAGQQTYELHEHQDSLGHTVEAGSGLILGVSRDELPPPIEAHAELDAEAEGAVEHHDDVSLLCVLFSHVDISVFS